MKLSIISVAAMAALAFAVPAVPAEREFSPLPAAVRLQDSVRPLLEDVDTDRVEKTVRYLASYWNRHANSEHGVRAQASLRRQIEALKEDLPTLEIEEVPIPNFKQANLVVRIPSNGMSDEVVIVGAHMDSINHQDRGGLSPEDAPAPGADDNASGVSTILEALRVLAKHGKTFDRNVEFHFYAAEERGLNGSRFLAKKYREEGVPVHAMMNNDMTGYVPPAYPTLHVAFTTDFTDPELTEFSKQVFGNYTKLGIYESPCGYACSDHAPWFLEKFRSSNPSETLQGHKRAAIHSTKDVPEGLNFERMSEHSKGVIGFIYELATL